MLHIEPFLFPLLELQVVELAVLYLGDFGVAFGYGHCVGAIFDGFHGEV